MLACAGVDRQHEYKQGWAPWPVRRGGGCAGELHADADGRVYAGQPAVKPVTMSAAVDGLEDKSALRNSSQACVHEENAFSACQNRPYIAIESRTQNQCAFGSRCRMGCKPGRALVGCGDLA